MIRQAISCDVCGRDKQQTNHWFVVYEHGAELRISGWNSEARNSTKAKHLCGQTCLHKLVDEYMARMLAVGLPGQSVEPASALDKPREAGGLRIDASLTTAAAHPQLLPVMHMSLTAVDEDASSARAASSRASGAPEDAEAILETPRFNSLAWRADAWKREREREQHNAAPSANARRRRIV